MSSVIAHKKMKAFAGATTETGSEAQHIVLNTLKDFFHNCSDFV